MKKFNFGHGILIGIIAFMAFISSFVFLSFQREIPLISNDYYEREITYQEKINAEKALIQTGGINYKETSEAYHFEIPSTLQVDSVQISGTCFRDKNLDFEVLLPIINNQFNFPKKAFASSIGSIEVNFESDQVKYHQKIILNHDLP